MKLPAILADVGTVALVSQTLRSRNGASVVTSAAWVLALNLVTILVFELLFPGSLAAILRRAISVGPIPGWWGYSAILNVEEPESSRSGMVSL